MTELIEVRYTFLRIWETPKRKETVPERIRKFDFFLLVSVLAILLSVVLFVTSGLAASKTRSSKNQIRTTVSVSQPSVTISEIQYWSGPEETYIGIYYQGSLSYKVERLSDELGIKFYTSNGVLKEGSKNIEINDGVIKSIKAEPILTQRGSQIIIKFVQPTIYEIQRMGKYISKGGLIAIRVVRPAPLVRLPEDPKEVVKSKKEKGYKIIIVDPGHGGMDYGAIGAYGLSEKNLTLAIARKLQEKINSIPGFRCILTRDGDYYVSLTRRRELAKEYDADLFVSIHLNAPGTPSRRNVARGTEIYYLSYDAPTDETARLVAERENTVDFLYNNENIENKDTLSLIFTDLTMTDLVNNSSFLGGLILDNLKQIGYIESRGVKCAQFAVLKLPIPSILIELGYITHPEEAILLTKNEFQEIATDKIASAIKDYFDLKMGVSAPVAANANQAAGSE